MDDPELEALRQRRMQEIQQQAAQQQAQEQQRQQVEMQLQNAMRQILTPEARDRLNNILLANPQMGQQIEMQLVQLAQSGRIPVPVDDDTLRSILGQITPKKREITIERR
ncbi:MAG: DNA-binding protein [Thermoplasmata archaeon]|nr:DNA-binding protein [Thermoplasmata archaeon]MBR4686183.1 DNA-binding protein [Candidatus Methanomethylophilaceae archaeon]